MAGGSSTFKLVRPSVFKQDGPSLIHGGAYWIPVSYDDHGNARVDVQEMSDVVQDFNNVQRTHHDGLVDHSKRLTHLERSTKRAKSADARDAKKAAETKELKQLMRSVVREENRRGRSDTAGGGAPHRDDTPDPKSDKGKKDFPRRR